MLEKPWQTPDLQGLRRACSRGKSVVGGVELPQDELAGPAVMMWDVYIVQEDVVYCLRMWFIVCERVVYCLGVVG